MGNEATRRWRRRGWRAFVDGLPGLVPARRRVGAAVGLVVVAVVSGVGARFVFAELGPVVAGAAGAVAGAGAVLVVVGVVLVVRGTAVVRRMPKVRVLDEGLVFRCLGEDDVVTADEITVDKLSRIVARTRRQAPLLMLGELVTVVGAAAVLLAAVLVGLSPVSVLAYPFLIVNAVVVFRSASDGLGRAETVAAAVRDGTVVAPRTA